MNSQLDKEDIKLFVDYQILRERLGYVDGCRAIRALYGLTLKQMLALEDQYKGLHRNEE